MFDLKKLIEIKNTLEKFNATLIAVTKTHSAETVQMAYNAGHRIFGENKVQELLPKYESLPKDIEWHLIGHLQSNKVKYIAPFVKMIHAVDSFMLLKEINKQAKKNNRVISCLLQIHIATEETKFGMIEEEVKKILTSEDLLHLNNIRIVGLMGMATNTRNEDIVRKEFHSLNIFFIELKDKFPYSKQHFKYLSMGMTNDFKIALKEGSNMIRVGSLIFGERLYNK